MVNKSFRIEVKVCKAGEIRPFCWCRWGAYDHLKCTNDSSDAMCDADNSEMRMTLLVRRIYSLVVWELLETSSTVVYLKYTTLQVNCTFVWLPCCMFVNLFPKVH